MDCRGRPPRTPLPPHIGKHTGLGRPHSDSSQEGDHTGKVNGGTTMRTYTPTTPTPTFKRKGVGGISAIPPTERHGARGVGHTGGYSKGPLPAPGMAALGIYDAAVYSFAAAL